MINTVREAHIAVEHSLQHVTSNRKQSIKPEFIDIALNFAVLQYVENSITPEKNVSQTGFDGTQVVYDELTPLKRDASLTVYFNKDLNYYYSILPSDYKHHVASKVNIHFNRQLPAHIHEEDILYKYVIEFPDNVYNDFEIHIGTHKSAINYKPNISVSRPDSKFIIVNKVIEYFRNVLHNDSIDVYWQNYNGEIHDNSFIIISKENIDNIHVLIKYTIDKEEFTLTSVKSNIVLNKIKDKSNRTSQSQITTGVSKNYISNNFYFEVNKHKSLNLSLIKGLIEIPDGTNFRPTKLNMDYIKIPTMIDYKMGRMSELTINEKIVRLAVQYLQAVIKDEGYQFIARENQTL